MGQKNGWFSIEDLEDFYTQGSISPKRTSFLIAQDENWAPQPRDYPWPEEDEEAERYKDELESDPPKPALFAWEIKVDDVSVADTLAKVLSRIKQLVTTGYSDRAAAPPSPSA